MKWISAIFAAIGATALLMTSDLTPAAPVVVHVQLTGPGAEWSTLGFATNYYLVALTTSNLLLPQYQWLPSYPVLDASRSFYLTGEPPIFINAYWQHIAQPGIQ